jgi:hypothetical protein
MLVYFNVFWFVPFMLAYLRKDYVTIIVIRNFKVYVFLWTYYIFIPFHEDNMDLHHTINESNISSEDICLADSATMYTFLRYKQYFSNLKMMKAKVNTIIRFNRLD